MSATVKSTKLKSTITGLKFRGFNGQDGGPVVTKEAAMDARVQPALSLCCISPTTAPALQMRRPFSTPLTYKTMRILLIEDNPGLRKIYLLALDDYEVTSATTAAEAKFLLGRHQFDIVLSDFNLTDGTSAKVFEQFPCPAPHVLLMTGASDDPQFQQMISRFGFPFLAKPFPPSVLRQRIEEMVAQPDLKGCL